MLTTKVCSGGCDVSAVTVFLCSECALSHSGLLPLFIHTIKKMLTRLFMSFPQCPHMRIHFRFLSVRESSHIYQIQSLCYASCRLLHLLIIYTKPVHTYSWLEACFWRDVHIEKKEATYSEVNLYKVNVIRWGVKEHIRHLPHTVHASRLSFNLMALEMRLRHSASNPHRLLLFPVFCYKTHIQHN